MPSPSLTLPGFISHTDGNEVFFKIKRTTKLNKLKTAYAERVGKQMNAIRCVFALRLPTNKALTRA